MASCEFDPALLQDFLDERLGEAERHRVADHLADCAACRKRHAGYVALDALLGALPPEDPPPLLAERVLRGLDREAADADEPRELGRAAAAVAAVLVAGVAAFAGGLFSPVGEWEGVSGWLWSLGQYVLDALSQGASTLTSLASAWAEAPAGSFPQTLALLVVLGAVAAATNHLALRRGAS